jgi:N-acetylmuramoyl-L-alanine amidase
MLPFFWYMLKVIICSGILFAYYWLFLRNKIFHGYNRFYLLVSIALSLLLPLLKINFWQAATEQSQAIRVLQAVSVGDEYMSNVVITAHKNNWSLEQLYAMAYWFVCIIFFLTILRTLFLIRTLLKKYPLQQFEDVAFVNTQHDSTPFSFLKYIFWNSDIDINTTTGRQIFKHELAHIQQMHTHDKIFVNIILIFCWCNPFFWLYRKELNMIHEFIADKKAVEDSDTAAFAAMILQAAYPKHRFELTNNFFYSPIKRRLLMLTKNKNPKVNYIGRIMVLPLVLLVFAAFTLKTKSNTLIYHGKKITVIIDAGHGGTDLGAASLDKEILEKQLTLDIAKKVKELNTNDAIEIILTREEDIFMSPFQKVDFAKEKNADLVISFHVDAMSNGAATKRSGISFWVSRDQYPNSNKSKILASALINEFNSNYPLPVLYPVNQREGGVWILQANTCPAVLIETGFINNDNDVAYLKTNAAKETIAKNVLMAIEKFASTNSITANPPQKEIIISSGKPVLKDTVPERIITGINPKAVAPLYIVNGYETDKATALDIKPEEIELVRVIKEDVALRVYGEKGKNGVVIINMKPGFGLPKNNFTAGTLRISDSATGKSFDATKSLIILDGIEYEYKRIKDIIPPSGFGDLSVKILNSTDAIKSYGEKGKHGAIVITTNQVKSGTSIQKSNDLRPLNEEARIYLGNNPGGRIGLDYLKAQKEVNVTNGYSFVSATLYFSGNFYDKVVQANLISNSLSSVEKYINQCNDGTVLTFDNLYLKDNNGQIFKMKNPPGFHVIDKSDDEVFTQVEHNPEFTGGDEAWRKFLHKHLKVHTPVDSGAKAGIYKVVLRFIVNTDGSLSDIKCESDPGFGMGTEAIRFIKTTPKWQPAVQNGKKVSAYLKQPITFVIEE